jgi:hypothetical protein
MHKTKRHPLNLHNYFAKLYMVRRRQIKNTSSPMVCIPDAALGEYRHNVQESANSNPLLTCRQPTKRAPPGAPDTLLPTLEPIQ